MNPLKSLWSKRTRNGGGKLGTKNSGKRAVLVGDVGMKEGIFHTGDEAMMLAAIRNLRARGFEHICVLSSNASDTAERYEVESLEPPALEQFLAHDPLEHLLHGIRRRFGRKKAIGTEWAELYHRIAHSDLALIAGGGNLHDSWPRHVVLRLIFAEMAHTARTTLIVSSQSVGPNLSGRNLQYVHRLMDLSDAFGLRESSLLETDSEDLKGLPREKLNLAADDAMFLDVELDLNHSELVPGLDPVSHFAVASFHPHPGDFGHPENYLDFCVKAVRETHEVTGLPIVLLPQEGETGPLAAPKIDVEFQKKVCAGVEGVAVFEAGMLSIEQCVSLIGNSSFVVSSRYHPIVWSLGHGVPCIGIAVDSYTATKIGGVLRQFSRGQSLVGPTMTAVADYQSLLRAAWRQRSEIRLKTLELGRQARTGQLRWWDFVSGADVRPS